MAGLGPYDSLVLAKGRFYSMWIAAIAFDATLWQAAWTRRADALLFINGMLLIAVASRLGLLAYMDVTALPAVNSLYMSPAAAPGILFVVLAPVAAVRAWRRERWRSSGSEPAR